MQCSKAGKLTSEWIHELDALTPIVGLVIFYREYKV